MQTTCAPCVQHHCSCRHWLSPSPSVLCCRALGCLDPQCALCQHNPNRRCVVNFDRKYLVNDLLKAKCGALIRIELVDRTTGLPIDEDIPDLRLEVGSTMMQLSVSSNDTTG